MNKAEQEASNKISSLWQKVDVKKISNQKLAELYEQEGQYLEKYYHDKIPVLSLETTNNITVALVKKNLNKNLTRILDVGCGPNPAVSLALASKKVQIIGIEVAPSMARLARKKIAQKGKQKNIKVETANAENLPFDSYSFDIVICNDVLEHIANLEKALKEMGRVCLDSGIIILTVPNKNRAEVRIKKNIDFLRGRKRPERDYYFVRSHLHEWTLPEFQKILNKCHLEIAERKTTGYPEWTPEYVGKNLPSIIRPFFKLVFRPTNWLIKIGLLKEWDSHLVLAVKKNC